MDLSLRGPRSAAVAIALKSGGANALAGAMILVGLVGLAREVIRLARRSRSERPRSSV
jgi:hypothetical protein